MLSFQGDQRLGDSSSVAVGGLRTRFGHGFDEFALAHADGCYARLLARLAKTDVLVLDDWGLAEVGPRERRDLTSQSSLYGLARPQQRSLPALRCE